MTFFDRLEDQTRGYLSRYPTTYAIIGGIGTVLFWRGVWEVSEDIGISSMSSIVIGTLVLLATGLFVSYFVGDQIILSGIKGEKKMIDKTREEISTEGDQLETIDKKLTELKEMVDRLSAK